MKSVLSRSAVCVMAVMMCAMICSVSAWQQTFCIAHWGTTGNTTPQTAISLMVPISSTK